MKKQNKINIVKDLNSQLEDKVIKLNEAHSLSVFNKRKFEDILRTAYYNIKDISEEQTIYTKIETKFSFRDKLRILFGRPVINQTDIVVIVDRNNKIICKDSNSIISVPYIFKRKVDEVDFETDNYRNDFKSN